MLHASLLGSGSASDAHLHCPCGEATPAQPWVPEDRKVLLRYPGARGRSFQLVTQQMLEGFWRLGLKDEMQPPLKVHKQTVPHLFNKAT